MPIRARPASLARRAVREALALGKARHGSKSDGKIHSLGTARNYEQSLKLAAEWARGNGHDGIAAWDSGVAGAYLEERAEAVAQKTLDLDRQALQVLPHVGKLPRIRSEIGQADPCGRAYSNAQIEAIAEAQQERHRLATEIAHAVGLRAHELYTLAPAAWCARSACRASWPNGWKTPAWTSRRRCRVGLKTA